MIKFAVIADIHLTEWSDTVQYDSFSFALNSIKASKVDAVVCLGDVTAYGELSSANYFLERMKEINVPKLFILGNSDKRSKKTAKEINIFQTEKEMTIQQYRFIGINTSEEEISTEDAELLKTSDENTFVFMHHPPFWAMKPGSERILGDFQQNGKYKALIHGHMHYYEKKSAIYSIQALDPDKAIGEPPCVTYFTVDGDEINTDYDYFDVSMPEGIDNFLGLSCFEPEIDIPYASENGLKNIELRPSAVYYDFEKLSKCVDIWRKKGGRYLSLHMPDFGYAGRLIGEKEWEDAIKIANALAVDGVTVHVPKASLKLMNTDARSVLLEFITKKIKELPKECKVGIENMHMTEKEKDDLERRFGYTPDECIDFMNMINENFGFERVGVLLDIGHARNNAPFSEQYPVGVWYNKVGKYAVGYHIHQVEISDSGMENHVPIKSFYGPLISYCGFAHCWNNNKINQRPLFLEIRGGYEKYSVSVKLLKR